MKSPHVYPCILLFSSYALLTGCNKASHHPTTPPPGPGITTANVTITNCVASPDPLPVNSGDTLIFKRGDANSYLVTFLPTSTPSGPSVPVRQNPFRVTGTSNTQIVSGPSNCTGGNGCDYKYTLNYIAGTVTQQPPCADPVIHIRPQSIMNQQQ